MKLYIGFFSIDYWVYKIIDFFSKAKRKDHVAIIIEDDTGAWCTYMGKRFKARFSTIEIAKKCITPVETIYIGEIDCSYDDVEELLNKYAEKFWLWRIVLWFFITRWFSNWKPAGGCAVIVSKMLIELGYDINIVVKPKDLFKELKDGNYIVGRKGWGW